MSNSDPSRRDSLIEVLAARLKVPYTSTSPHPFFIAHRINLTNFIYLAGMQDLRIIEPLDQSPPDDDTYNLFRELAGQPLWRDRIKILVLPAAKPELLSRFSNIDNTVVLNTSQVDTITKSKSPLSTLKELLRDQIGVLHLNPYQYAGAVTGNRFFGRSRQLDIIANHPDRSYLVTGTRMSGKTSLLLEAKKRILENQRITQESATGVPPAVIYVDCKRFSSIAGLMNGILTEMEIRDSFVSYERWESPQRWHEFYKYLRSAAKRRPDRLLHIFLDEYDTVTDFDKRESALITWNFRALHQANSIFHGTIQFVFAGSMNLASLARDNQSALYNFVDCEGGSLENFTIGDIKQLLELPMEDLGIGVEDRTLAAEVLLHETAGRPASAQFICAEVVNQLGSLRRYTVTDSSIKRVAQSVEYHHYYKGTLFENVDTLEGFILSIESDGNLAKPTFSQEDIAAVVSDKFALTIEPKTLFHHLDNLVKSGFVNFDRNFSGTRYQIAAPVIKRIYRLLPPEQFIPDLIEKGLVKRKPKS